MPVLAFFLGKIGILSSKFLRSSRRYAIVVILVLAGILTPSPDVASMVMMALPLYALFEISILVVAKVEERKG
jgi:sec-independent protein translocase protein TatC